MPNQHQPTQDRSPLFGTNYLEFEWFAPKTGTAVPKRSRCFRKDPSIWSRAFRKKKQKKVSILEHAPISLSRKKTSSEKRKHPPLCDNPRILRVLLNRKYFGNGVKSRGYCQMIWERKKSRRCYARCYCRRTDRATGRPTDARQRTEQEREPVQSPKPSPWNRRRATTRTKALAAAAAAAAVCRFSLRLLFTLLVYPTAACRCADDAAESTATFRPRLG